MKILCIDLANPDWWNVIVTSLAAIFAAIVAIRLDKGQSKLQRKQLDIQERQNYLQEQQLKLQEQQNKLQEQQIRQNDYDIHKRIYDCICNINIYANILIYKVYMYVSSTDRLDVFSNNINQLNDELNTLHAQLDECSCDIEIKCSKPNDIITNYYRIINETRRIIVELKKITLGEKILPQYDEREIGVEDIESIISFIAERCDKTSSLQIYKNLNEYSVIVKDIIKKNYHLEIRKFFKYD